MNAWMDRWVDGRTDGRMDGWMDVFTDSFSVWRLGQVLCDGHLRVEALFSLVAERVCFLGMAPCSVGFHGVFGFSVLCIGRRLFFGALAAGSSLRIGRRLLSVHWSQALVCAKAAGSSLSIGRRLFFVVHWPQVLCL